ncbi:MAG: hypothetical protein H7Z16_00835 [Pyrinomonadaceae bacterium]|nr:hypothetical protein [Pyrinomonadaceae bacterium]
MHYLWLAFPILVALIGAAVARLLKLPQPAAQTVATVPMFLAIFPYEALDAGGEIFNLGARGCDFNGSWLVALLRPALKGDCCAQLSHSGEVGKSNRIPDFHALLAFKNAWVKPLAS